MAKCSCYVLQNDKHFLTDFEKGVYSVTYPGNKIPNYIYQVVGVCNGTRESERCKCGGDKCKCDFYEDVRIEGKKELSAEKKSREKAVKLGGIIRCEDCIYWSSGEHYCSSPDGLSNAKKNDFCSRGSKK